MADVEGAKHINRFKGVSLRKAFEKIKNGPIDFGKSRITSIDKRLKQKFWDLIERGLREDTRIPLSSIHRGICSYTHFYQNVVNNPAKFKWLLTPGRLTQLEQQKIITDLTYKKLFQLLDTPLTRPDGKIITSNAKLLLEAVKILDEIVYGPRRRYKG